MKELRITKMVEQTTVKFIAEDGTEFLEERACKDYERRLAKEKIANRYRSKIRIAELKFPYMDCNGELDVDLIRLNSYEDYETVVDYLKNWSEWIDVYTEEPGEYPCVKILGYNDGWADFGYDGENIQELISRCREIADLVETAISQENGGCNEI